MKPPRVYGSEKKARAALARFIGLGEELLDQAGGGRKRIAAVSAMRHRLSVMPFVIEDEWAKDVRRWFSNARRGVGSYLQDQMEELLPVLTVGLPPNTGKPRHHFGLDNGVPWLGKALEEPRAVQTLSASSGMSPRLRQPPHVSRNCTSRDLLPRTLSMIGRRKCSLHGLRDSSTTPSGPRKN